MGVIHPVQARNRPDDLLRSFPILFFHNYNMTVHTNTQGRKADSQLTSSQFHLKCSCL